VKSGSFLATNNKVSCLFLIDLNHFVLWILICLTGVVNVAFDTEQRKEQKGGGPLAKHKFRFKRKDRVCPHITTKSNFLLILDILSILLEFKTNNIILV
jgi:hypothetical protein